MEEIKIKGILAKDATTDWKEDFENEVKESICGVMWKDQMSNLGEIKGLLQELISKQGYFDYYNIANNVSDYHGKIIDFATKEEYPAKVQEWEKKNPAWFKKSFDEYAAGNQKAVIAFLVEDFKKIPKEAQIHVNQFKFYDKIPSVKNAVAYIDILTKEKLNQQAMINEIKQLLNHNHNLILTGAPGTGKTYLAKQVAQRMIFGEIKKEMTDEEEKQFDEQCGFVQFHPSYDYTDFVEGLRPKQDDNGNVAFERKDGVFKKFCAKAIAKETTEENKFDEIWDKFIADIRVKLSNGELTKIGNWEYGLSTKDSLKYSSINTPSQYSFTITKKNILDTYCGRQARPSGAFQKDMLDIVQHLKQTYNLSDKPEQTNSDDKTTKQYVFIIDEINRGEISKIFGELFFSIDPGYRGTDGKVKTQYQNLIEEDDEFFDGFYVPENVYIIGTMNDIDRSVESMDFAFRRRFAFKEVTANDSQAMLNTEKAWGKDNNENSLKPDDNTIVEIKDRMNKLNNVIWHKPANGESEKDKCIEGLSSAYHIGASYFLKLKNYRNDDGSFDYDKLWEYHLEGLLFEYLRGTTDISHKIKSLANAYGYTKADKYE